MAISVGKKMNLVNPSSPGFPQETPSMATSNSAVLDHAAEIAAAESSHYAAHAVKPMSSKNHHLSKERRNRPHSMDHGIQAVDGKKAAPEGMETAKQRAMEKKAGFPVSNKPGK